MSSTNPQKPTSPGAGDAERTQQIPRINSPSSASEKSSEKTSGKSVSNAARPAGTGASPASRSMAGSSTQTEPAKKAPAKKAPSKAPAKKGAAAGEPRTVGEKLAARAAQQQAEAAKSETAASGAAKPAGASGTGTSTPAKKATPSPAPAKDAGKSSSGSSSSSKTTSTPTKGDAAKTTAQPSGKESVAPERESARTPGSPMTARDYARTTRESADSTSVMPVVPDASSSASSSPQTAHVSGRQAQLRLVHVDPWSVTKLSFVVSVALMLVSVVAVFIFWIVLDLAGVWDSLNGTISNVLSDGEAGFDLTDYLGLGRLVGLTLLLSAINVIVMTMIATVGAHLYNLFAQLLGGVDVTFTDK